MFNSLKSKFFISFIVIEILFLFLIAGINFNSLDKASETLIEEKINVTSQLLVELVKTPIIVYDLATLDDIVKNFSIIKNVVAIQIETPQHRVLSTHIKDDSISRELFNSFIDNSKSSNSQRVDDYIFNYVDIKAEDKILAHVHFVFNTSAVFHSIQENKNLTYLLILLALIVGLVVSYTIGNNLGKSLEKLTEIAKGIAEDKRVSIPYSSKRRDEMGELFYTMHMMQELITDRTLNLHNSLNNLQQFTNALDQSAIVSKTDPNGTITYVNEKFCTSSGYSEDELLGQNHRILRDPKEDKNFYTNMWNTITNKKIFRGTFKNIKKNGDPYYVDATIVPLLDDFGDIIEYIAIRYEVTEIVDAKNRALEAKRAKEEFLSNMSHEIRTPMNAILGFVKILQKNTTDPKNREYLDIITSSSNLLLHIINDILDLSKIENDKLTIDTHSMNPKDELNKVVSLFSIMAKEKSINFIASMDESTPKCLEGDLLRIKQIVFNFLSNSLKFTPENKNIFIHVKYSEGILHISVKDEGIGMSEESKERIFNAFEQADNSTTRKYGGTGLGLTISSRLAKLMNGKITIDTQENIGSTFTLSIPLKECSKEKFKSEAIEEAQVPEEGEAKKFSGNILVAEDNKTNQMLIKLMLDEYELPYTIAQDGLEAVKIFKSAEFDMVLMDENMPNMTGSKACEEIRKYEDEEQLPHTPIVALTANVLQEDIDRFMASGMNDFVAKPIDSDELERVLDKFLKE